MAVSANANTTVHERSMPIFLPKPIFDRFSVEFLCILWPLRSVALALAAAVLAGAYACVRLAKAASIRKQHSKSFRVPAETLEDINKIPRCP